MVKENRIARVFGDRSEEIRMRATLTLSKNEDAYIIKNLWPLYVHDIAAFELHRGKWEVVTWPNHDRAIAFWRRVLGRYLAARNVSEAEVDHPFGRRVAFQFENG